MSIQPNAVKVCDLIKGRIVLEPEAVKTLEPRSQVQISVGDASGSIHEQLADVIDGAFHFDKTGFVYPIRTFAISRPLDGAKVFEARNLFPASDREFETQFKSHRDRSGNLHVDYFVASQIFRHFQGQEGYRISASVTAAYKSIELMDRSYLDEAEGMLSESLRAIHTVGLARSTRNNREHLNVSLLCAQYHVYLAQGKPREFLQTLFTLSELLRHQDFNSYYNLAYNGALSLRLLVLLQLIAGQLSDARATAALSFDLFKHACRDADDNLAHFKELRYVHDNTYESMRLARRVKEVPKSLLDKTLRSCLRISGENFPLSFEKMTKTYTMATELQK